MTKKVLMLHGLAQSGPYFESKTKGFRRVLEPLGYEFYYPTAPNKISPADLPVELGDVEASNGSEFNAWIVEDPTNGEYRLPETSIQFLRQYILDNGPFDGIVGFSQGAGVTGYLMTDFHGLLGFTPEEHPPIKFFMAFSGFRFRPEIYQEQYDKNIITVPSLHVQGTLDTVTEPEKVQLLFKSCREDTRTFLQHAGGHFVPNSKGFVLKVADWLKEVDP